MNSLPMFVEKAKEWLQFTCTGDFTDYVFGKTLGIESANTRDEVLADLVSLNLIEPIGGVHGRYAKVRRECPRIEWATATEEYYPIWLPFRLHDICGVRKKNIVVFAGDTNAGKTLAALQIAYRNLRTNGGQHDRVNYFSSEMAADELRARLLGIDHRLDSWHGLDARDRVKDFHSIIEPDGLNIIDFMEISSEFYLVASYLQKIYEKLRNGVCFVMLQKKAGAANARGGDFSLEKARLAVSISHHFGVNIANITKCKNPINGKNPQGKEYHYRIHKGVTTEQITGWRYYTQKERERMIKIYEQEQAERGED